ncbi:MAG: GTP-binding protein [Thermoplasmata archaeon]|nr:GTP-binding protein [Candidatus Sysuiplasma acidicola]MDH2905344.1 GTP-binding protein [Methanomassiliicoccales archaeon]
MVIQLNEEIKTKVCLVGDNNVGKTSLIRRFVLDSFDDKYTSTIGTKVTKKEVNVKRDNGREVSLSMLVWDIMGQKGFRELLRESYFYGAEAAVCVCDVTNRESLDELKYWIKSMESITGHIPMIFIGNKNDLVDQIVVTRQDIDKVATSYGSPAMVTSAKTGENVEAAFMRLASMLTARK